MSTSTAKTIWESDFKKGIWKTSAASSAFKIPYSHSTRFENEKNSNPKELIAAAHSTCYYKSLTEESGKAGYQSQQILLKIR